MIESHMDLPSAPDTSLTLPEAYETVRVVADLPCAAPVTPHRFVIQGSNSHHGLYLKINSTGPVERQPANVFCIVDVSWSMNNAVTIKQDNGDKMTVGSRLSLVKTTLETLIMTMNDRDRLS